MHLWALGDIHVAWYYAVGVCITMTAARALLVGSYCEWNLTEEAMRQGDSGRVYQCFEEMKKDLFIRCDYPYPHYNRFVWTPTNSTPDLLYYQVTIQSSQLYTCNFPSKRF